MHVKIPSKPTQNFMKSMKFLIPSVFFHEKTRTRGLPDVGIVVNPPKTNFLILAGRAICQI